MKRPAPGRRTPVEAKLLNAMVDRPGEWVEPIRLIGVAGCVLCHARDTLRRLHNEGLLDRRTEPRKFVGEEPAASYRVKPGVQKVEVPTRAAPAPKRASAGVRERILDALQAGAMLTTDLQATLGVGQTAVLKALKELLDEGSVVRFLGEARAGWGQRPWIWSLVESGRAAS